MLVDTLGNSILQIKDSCPVSPLMGWDSVCRQPFLGRDTLVPSMPSLPLFEGVPLSGAGNDVSLMVTIVGYVICFLCIIAFLRVEGKGVLGLFFLYVFSRKRTSDTLRENIVQSYIYGWWLLLLSYSVIALGIAFFWADVFSWKVSMTVFFVLLGYQLSYYIILSVLGWTFNASRCAFDACLVIHSNSIVMGLLLSPFILSLFFIHEEFIPILLGIMVFLFLCCLLIKWIRLLEILFYGKISVFYMILYLCILEIIPMLVLYKLLV